MNAPNIDMTEAKAKHIYSIYDGTPMIAVYTYQEQDFLLYCIEWNVQTGNISYMLTTVDAEDLRELCEVGVKQFLGKCFDAEQLYYYEFSMETGETIGDIRLLTITEKLDCFPMDEFVVEHDYMEGNT